MLDKIIAEAIKNMGGAAGGAPGAAATAGGSSALIQVILSLLSGGGAAGAGGAGGLGGLGSLLGGSAGSSGGLGGLLSGALGGASSAGGLEALIRQFEQAGLGAQAKSWVSTGQNEPVSADDLGRVFGADRMREMAQQAGMSRDAFGGALADALPRVVDRLTPQGQVPAGGLEGALAELSRMMPR